MKIFILLYIVILLLMCGCNNGKNACLKSAGEPATEHVDVGNFDKLCVKSNFDVHIKRGACNVAVTAGKNLLPLVACTVTDGVLQIENSNRCNWLHDYQVPQIDVFCPTLSAIEILNPCDLHCDDTLCADVLVVNNLADIFHADFHVVADSVVFKSRECRGEYLWTGASRYAVFHNVGDAYLDAKNFVCDTIDILHNSLQNSDLNASRLLNILMAEHGTIYSFSGDCPVINAPGLTLGTHFVNFGCQQ